MSKGGLDLLVIQAQALLAAEMQRAWDCRAHHGVSPIEALFDIAINTVYRIERSAQFIQPFVTDDWRAEVRDYAELYEGSQVRVLDWPVDFLFGVVDFNEERHFAVVECDGHEFHERTKEQAKRDRSRDRRLQEAGFRVFRFTGSEIYRDPIGCVREVLNWADTASCKGLPTSPIKSRG